MQPQVHGFPGKQPGNGPYAPIRLPANQPIQFYRGGSAIAEFRCADSATAGPEDWIASTTTRFGRDTEGLTRLPDGRWLREAVQADPDGWLGPEHVGAFGACPALLVKLLDAGQRLPVHVHPTDTFAQRHLNSCSGKTEAWIILGTRGDDATVYAGFRHPQDKHTISAWVHDQSASAMLAALNAVPVRPGDTLYIPAGLPHAIGEGVFLLELQQPTDFSLTLEWRNFLPRPEQAHLGLGFATALEALDTSGWDTERLQTLIRHPDTGHTDAVDLLPDGAQAFFRADQLRPMPALTLDPSFAVLVVIGGSGMLRTESGVQHPLHQGETFAVPYGAGQLELMGPVSVIRCRPPEPSRLPAG